MNVVERARRLAIMAHDGQKDKIGTDYFARHVEVVASHTREYGGSDKQVAAAYLHDVVEDTDTTIDEIRQMFSVYIADVVNALTRRPGETYNQFIYRVTKTPDAILVKIADIRSNTDPSRLLYLPRDDRERLARKYSDALPILWGALE